MAGSSSTRPSADFTQGFEFGKGIRPGPLHAFSIGAGTGKSVLPPVAEDLPQSLEARLGALLEAVRPQIPAGGWVSLALLGYSRELVKFGSRQPPESAHEALLRSAADTAIDVLLDEFTEALYRAYPALPRDGVKYRLYLRLKDEGQQMSVTAIGCGTDHWTMAADPAAILEELSTFASRIEGYQHGFERYHIDDQGNYPGRTAADALQLWAALTGQDLQDPEFIRTLDGLSMERVVSARDAYEALCARPQPDRPAQPTGSAGLCDPSNSLPIWDK